MAHGLPDWYRGVDIAYQALSELITRPTYGGGLRAGGTDIMTASSANTLVNISGQGMIYGGNVRLDHTSTQKDSRVRLTVDGNEITYHQFLALDYYSIDQPRASPIVIFKYDEVNFIYAVGLAYGITFETSLKLEYLENHGSNPVVTYDLIYALI